MPKIKRQKAVKKYLQFYQNSFGIKPPYSVVLDGTFCRAALKSQVNIGDQLPKYLDAEVKVYTTKCVLSECEALGPLLYGPLKILKQYEVSPCKHKFQPFPAHRCLSKMARQKKDTKFLIGTQDPELSEDVRKIPGTPLLYIAHTAINLEAPSSDSRTSAAETLSNKLAPSTSAQECLTALKRKQFGETEIIKKRKRKGPKGPNPMSCKKKKQKTNTAVSSGDSKVKATRKRKKNKKPRLSSEHE